MMNHKLKLLLKTTSFTLLTLLIILTIAVVIAPKLIQLGAVYWLDEQGIQAEISDINIDISNGEFELIGAKGKNQYNQGFNVDLFKVGIELQPLFDNIINIQSIVLSGFSLDIEHENQLIKSVGGILIPTNTSKTNQAPESNGQPDEPWSIQLQDITFNNIESCNHFKTPNKTLCFSLGELIWSGNLNFITNQAISQNPDIQIHLDIKDIGITHKNSQKKALNVQSMSIDNLSMQGTSEIKFDLFTIADINALPRQKESEQEHAHIVLLDKFAVSKLNFSNLNKLDIQTISLKGMGINIVKDKKNHWNVLDQIHETNPYKTSTNDSPSNIETDKKAQPLDIKINEIILSDSQAMVIKDNSLNTPYESFNIIKLISIGNINTATPLTPNPVKLNLITKNHGEISLEGDAQLLSGLENFNIKGFAKGIDLRPISSYIESAIGHRVKSGQLNAGIKLLSENGEIDSLLDIDLKKFKLRSISDAEKEKLNKELELGMPLDVALDMLRDGDDNINIKLPITGNIDAPEFDPSDAIYTALSKAITAAIINYYTPFGLVAVAEGIFDLATALSFEPILYKPGETIISDADADNLNKIVSLMTQRPKIHLTLCGQSNKSDLKIIAPEAYSVFEEKEDKVIKDEKLIAQLNNIASNRSENIKTLLMEKKITADKLILCEPEYKYDGISGVEISL